MRNRALPRAGGGQAETPRPSRALSVGKEMRWMCEVEPSESAWLKRVAKAASAASPIRIGAPGVSWNQGRSPKSGFLVGPPSSPL